MAYVLKECFANPNNYGGQRQLSDIKFIVIHYTANDGDSDENNGNYFKNNIRNASSHYFVKWNTATAKDNYLKLKFDLDNTVGARSLSKTEIIKQYYNTYIKKS